MIVEIREKNGKRKKKNIGGKREDKCLLCQLRRIKNEKISGGKVIENRKISGKKGNKVKCR